MASLGSRLIVWIALGAIAVGCAPTPSSSTRTQASAAEGQRPAAFKRITAAINGELASLNGKTGVFGVPGVDASEELVNAGLANLADRDTLRPQLAEAVPSLENGLWKLFPDGKMETTWTIRPNAKWHDGAPFTSADLVFTAEVVRDVELPSFADVAYTSIESVEAPDARTVVVRWNRPYIDADRMFTRNLASPLPKHKLEQPYTESKATFLELPFWTREFVGTGPYQVHDWVPASHLVLHASDTYVLGRPKIDEIEVRFIRDPNAMAAAILGGAIDVTVGRTLALDQAIEVRDQWRDGRMDIGFKSWIVMFPQHVSPDPPIVSDARFKRALLHAIDRQALVDELHAGLTPVAHSYLNPNQPQYREIEANLPQYQYDPRIASQMIEGLGYARGADGIMVDSTGRKLGVEIRNIQQISVDVKTLLAVDDYWQRVGVETETILVPSQRMQDREYRSNSPGFQLFQNPNDIPGLLNLHSSRVPLRENEYRAIGNHARYMNPELDAMIDRFYATVPRQDRIQVLGQIVQHVALQLPVMGLFYSSEPTLIGNRLLNVSARKVPDSIQSWNANEWDVK